MVQKPSIKNRMIVPSAELEFSGGALELGSVSLSGAVGGRATAACEKLVALLDGKGAVASLELSVQRPGTTYPALDMDESYELCISGSGIEISAPQEWGAIRALSLLADLLDEDSQLPCLEARDAPSHAWRGLMLDPARRFLSLAALKRTLLGMWACRLNVLHLHLSDDQGLRVPLLGRTPAGRYYSREELHELVEFAADLGIRVVPEIDIPGHATALLASFPHWAKDAPPSQASKRFGVHSNFVDCANPRVVREFDELLAELAELFPDPYLHLGGDECVGYDKPPGLSALLSEMASRRGKRLILWDEALEEDLPETVAVQVWRHHTLLETSRRHGHATILSAPYYLDLMYSAELHHLFDPGASLDDRQAAQARLISDPWLGDARAPLKWYEGQTSGLASALEKELLPKNNEGALLGGEACLWGELVDEAQLDTRLWSRMPAIASRFWLGKESSLPDPQDVHKHLRRVANIRVGPEAWLESLDLNASERGHLACLLNCLEPIKWYLRLLGGALSERMEEAQEQSQRPYSVDSALGRVVDFVAPESSEAQRFAAAEDKGEFAQAWRSQYACLVTVAERHELFREVIALSARLADLAGVLRGRLSLEGFFKKHPQASDPVAELTLAVLPLVQEWKRSSAENGPRSS